MNLQGPLRKDKQLVSIVEVAPVSSLVLESLWWLQPYASSKSFLLSVLMIDALMVEGSRPGKACICIELDLTKPRSGYVYVGYLESTCMIKNPKLKNPSHDDNGDAAIVMIMVMRQLF
ncbi:hypothetical protein ACH5RR_023489 [Cinchona calisaya]|uniref:Uncharacterized protein n=1 Tax=Cinchona calisaya TaxID=153742 RepID=A0ABD2ZEQ8_9GENT